MMKKYNSAFIALLLITTLVACKRNIYPVSEIIVASYPTITISGSQFYSIPVGGALPTVTATAYDSTLNESYPASLDASGLDNTTPGLYFVPIKATNRFGYISSKNVYIAVTDIPAAWDLSGLYQRTANGADVNLTEVANGIYEVDNVGGAPSLPVVGYFVQIDDSTITFPMQPTDNVGDVDCINEKLMVSPPDTSYSWNVVNPFFGTANRTFVKQ